MGSRKDRRQAIRDAANVRWRRYLANGVANQPSATVLGPEFRDETDLEVEVQSLEARRAELESDLSRLHVDHEDNALAEQLRRDIEQLEGAIARERQTKKD